MNRGGNDAALLPSLERGNQIKNESVVDFQLPHELQGDLPLIDALNNKSEEK